MNIIQQLEKEQVATIAAQRAVPVFGAGDTVIVNVKVKEGERTRVQAYEGVVHRPLRRRHQRKFHRPQNVLRRRR